MFRNVYRVLCDMGFFVTSMDTHMVVALHNRRVSESEVRVALDATVYSNMTVVGRDQYDNVKVTVLSGVGKI